MCDGRMPCCGQLKGTVVHNVRDPGGLAQAWWQRHNTVDELLQGWEGYLCKDSKGQEWVLFYDPQVAPCWMR